MTLCGINMYPNRSHPNTAALRPPATHGQAYIPKPACDTMPTNWSHLSIIWSKKATMGFPSKGITSSEHSTAPHSKPGCKMKLTNLRESKKSWNRKTVGNISDASRYCIFDVNSGDDYLSVFDK